MWKKLCNSIQNASVQQRVIAIALAVCVLVGAGVAVIKLNNHTSDSLNTPIAEQTEADETKDALSQVADKEKEETEAIDEKSTDDAESGDSKTGTATANKGSGSTNTNPGNGGTTNPGTNNGNNNGSNNGSGNAGSETKADTQCTVTFVTGEGTPIAAKKVEKGTKIQALPTAYRDGYIFTSWYYDEARTETAVETDGINHDTTLYAQYVAQAPMEALEQKTFVSATDVEGSSFQISVEATDKKMTAEAVKAAITASNLTDPQQTDIINVSGAAGSFVVSGRNPEFENNDSMQVLDGFAAGSTYRIALDDERLNFKDQDTSVREYNFTTAKTEVLNTTLNDDIRYIPMQDLSNITNNGETVASLSIALYEADSDGKLGPAELTQGSFDYTAGTLKVGDVVSVYAGLRPDQRTLETPESENGDVAYIEITGKNGNRYTYQNADPEDVIFEPDMLPVPESADLDSASNTITVAKDVLDYSADVYANIELDSQTTADVGDFLMFYSGIFGITEGEDAASITGYAKITSVTENNDDTTTIGYETVSWEDVCQTMDIYASQPISGEDMIEGVDTEQLEKSIEEQAVSTGFAEEAAQYLGSLALATNNFTKLSENMNLSDYKVTLEDGTPITPEELQLMASNMSVSCEMEKGYPKATISTHPERLGAAQGTAAKDKGLSVKLEVQAKITIGKKGTDNQVTIVVTGTFQEEVGLDIGVSSKAIWKVWGIFPYIAEYRVTANLDVLNYTGIEVNAMMMTGQADKEHSYDDALDIADEIKNLIKSADQKDGEDDEKEENSKNLVKRYSEMLEADSDWVRMLEQNIVNQEWRVPPALPIIAVKAEANFVIKMDACISIGFDFEYQTGKRYTYTVDVFAGQVYNDTVSLLEETYQFSFYTMGRLAVKAGIEFEFKVGLFSTDLDSVGFRAEAGAYTKLWGYFYYELHYSASAGKSRSYSGVLLIDVGAYLELGLKAQAFNDRYKAEAKLVDKEWSLYTVGNQDSILNFATEQEEMPYIKLKQHIRSAVIPDSVFLMDYLDLKDGKEKQAVYNDYFDESKKESSTNRKNFEITMTNDKFSYDPQTNTITVNPAAGDKKLEGDMIITWNRYPLAFSSRPIQRRIHLYWDNVRDGYVIVPYTNGGSYLDIINAKYEAKVKEPEAPTKLGYDFAGWYRDEACTEPYQFPEKMPAEDTNIYAKWTPSTNTVYTVEHYQEQLRSGEYELTERETLTGTTDSSVTPEVKDYTGYYAPAKQEIKINADGSTTMRYYYALQTHTVTFDPGEVGGESITYELKYGGTVIAPELAAKGYTFAGWDQTISGTMGTENVTYTAQWTKKSDTDYRVEYYVEDVNGAYRLQDLVEGKGITGALLSVENLRYQELADGQVAEQKYNVANGIVFENMTVNGAETENAEIAADGKTIIKLNYRRLSHKVTFDWGFDDRTDFVEDRYEAEIPALSAIERAGYTFDGWYEDADLSGDPVEVFQMAAEDRTLYAKWIANTDTRYVVEHYQQDLNGDFTLTDREEKKGTTDTSVTPKLKTYAGFTVPEVQEVIIKGDGSTVVRYEYTRNTYTITFAVNGGEMEADAAITALYGSPITLPTPVRDGYGFTGWYVDGTLFTEAAMPADNVTLTAGWAAGKYSYTVNHYLQNLEDPEQYTLVDSEPGVSDMDSEVTPARKQYTGFETPEKEQTITIGSDGTKNVVSYYYTRKQYQLVWNLAGGKAPAGYTVGSVLYEAPIIVPVPEKTGYSYTWDATPELKMPANDLTYTAKWTANQYQVRFDVNGGTVESNSDITGKIVTFDQAYGELPKLTKTGYIFGGWFDAAGGGNEITAETIVKTDRDHTLYAQFTPIRYQIRYGNMDGAQNSPENAAEFTIEDNKIVLRDPIGKPGYTFDGWYTDTGFEKPVSGELTLGIGYDWIFYAKWKANPYTITLDSCLGDMVKMETVLMTYDEAANLPLLSTIGRFNKPGYTFMGWSTEKGGAVNYTDGQNVKNLATSGNVTLYAVWSLNRFNISYELGAGGVSQNNPTEYSIEDGDITLKAPTAKAGYQFLGWYDGDTKVTEIVRGTQQDYALTAKWAHGGYFNLSYVGLTHTTLGDGSNGYKLTYKVTRTIPEGTIATQDPQHVYYRTVNGTAYGSTVEVEIAGDKYHFKHVGGEDVYLTFGQNDMEQTFTVEEWGAYAGGDMAATSQIGNTARYYNVELYKVVDTVGNCQGALGNTSSYKRVMSVLSGSSVIGSEIFNKVYSYQMTDGQRTVTDDGYDKNPSFTFRSYTEMIGGLPFTDIQNAYIRKVNTGAGFRLSLDMKEKKNGNCWIKFTSTTTGSVLYERRDIDLPDKNWHNYNYPGSSDYVWTTMDDHIRLNTDASGKGANDWVFGSSWVVSTLRDNRAPQQVGIANLAFGHYKKGETISITVIYDEVINSAANIGFNKVDALPISNVTYVDGVGTNALTFTATVTADDFEVTPDTNNAIKNLKPVTGTVKDILGN